MPGGKLAAAGAGIPMFIIRTARARLARFLRVMTVSFGGGRRKIVTPD
jgi:hypothetical protein